MFKRILNEIKSEYLAICVTIGCLLVAGKFLSEDISNFVARVFGMIEDQTDLLLVDVTVSLAIYLAFGAVAYVVTVNKQVDTAYYASVAYLVFTAIDRWAIHKYGWPVWYELSLLVGIMVGVNGGASLARWLAEFVSPP